MRPPRTFIILSSLSLWSGSARSASSCTPAAAATSRSRPTCAFMCALKSSSSSTALPPGRARWSSRGAHAGEAVMPSYTHLQRAEPVLVAHWLLAYVEMALRDADRLLDCAARLNFCPLGSGAVAGATLAARSHHRRARTRIHGADRQFDGRDQRSRLHPRVSATRSRLSACTSAGLPRRSRYLPPRSSASSRCPKHFLPDRAPCRRRRIPT